MNYVLENFIKRYNIVNQNVKVKKRKFYLRKGS